MPGPSPGKTTGGWFDASTTQPHFVPRTALHESDPRVKPTADPRELSPEAEPAYSAADRPLFPPGTSAGPPRSQGRQGTL